MSLYTMHFIYIFDGDIITLLEVNLMSLNSLSNLNETMNFLI